MNKPCKKIIFTLALTLMLFLPTFAHAQSSDLTLSLSRDFGYAWGGDIQGTFSMRANSLLDLARVVFFIDEQQVGEDVEAPFRYQFNTDSYPLGVHTMRAVGYTTSGQELPSNEIQTNFVSASQGGQSVTKFILPLIIVVVVITLLGSVGPALLGRKKLKELPLGAPRQYGSAGGAICPRCKRPFSRNFLSPNMLVGKLERCPFCGKWSILPSASPAALAAAEQAEREMAQQLQQPDIDDQDWLRKEIDDTKYSP
jgi:hypothetical protein